MFQRIAEFSVKFRWAIIVLWIVAIPILYHFLPNINNVSKSDNSQFLPKNSATEKASSLETTFVGKHTQTVATLVASRPNTPLTEADNANIDSAVNIIKKDKSIGLVRNVGTSKDGEARQIFIGITGNAFGNNANNIVSQIRSQVKPYEANGLQMNLTGQLPIAVDSDKSNSKGRNNTEGYTLLLIVVLLLVVFRAILAPLITLIPAFLSLIIAQPVIAESSKIGVQVSPITQILLIVLLLGAGTDYGLFLVFRTREELRKGADTKQAVVKALCKVGESITFSAATVAAALLCLLLASFGIYKGLGPALAIGLGIMLLAALTFLPAMLAILGRAVFWPAKTQPQELKIGLWGKLADKVIERPKLMIAVGSVLFIALSLGVIGYKTTGFTNNGSSNSKSDSSIGQAVLTKHFPASAQNTSDVLFVYSKPVWGDLAAVDQAQQRLAKLSDFKAVSGPFTANGFKISPAELQKAKAENKKNPEIIAAEQYISSDGKLVRFQVVPNVGPSGSTTAVNATPKLIADVQKVAEASGVNVSYVYGQDTASYDISHIANNDLKRIIPIVLLVIAVILAIMLRSLVAPWYLILTVGLSYLASLGLAMIVFVHIGGSDGLNFILPFMMFIFSMALGEDYNILIMSRIREEAHHPNTSLKDAITKAIGITGTTVTSAGLILAGTFSVFGLAGGSQQFEEIGWSIAFGILLDTFFVRTLFVPSIVALLGKKNWWPSHLSKDS